MPAPFMVAALAAGATYLTQAVIQKYDFKSDDLMASFEVMGKDVPVAGVVAAGGLVALMGPAWLGAVGMGAMFGAAGAWTTSTTLKGEIEAAQKFLGSADKAQIPDWLEAMAQ